VDSIKAHALLLFGMLGLMWATEILDLLPFMHLDRFGIRPRTLSGLVGIVCAPFLHASFAHLLSNSVPFLILGGVVLLGGRTVFWRVTLFVMLAGGFGVWLVAARHSNHLGASGLIFGYLGFLLARGFFERSVVWILVSFIMLVLYGGLILGVLPLRTGISFESHLFGFLAGIVAARWMFSGKRKLFG
jgi:membrane associated rhomboid family serine protease